MNNNFSQANKAAIPSTKPVGFPAEPGANGLNPSKQLAPENIQFIDYRSIEWQRVQRTRCLIHQRFHYDYPGPVRELRHRLVVVPTDQHGYQRLCEYQLNVSVPALSQACELDNFGNRIFQFHIAQVDTKLDFDVWTALEQSIQPATRPLVPAEQAHHYLMPTRLTTADATIAAVAHKLSQQHQAPAQLAESINDWTFLAMRYERGVTKVNTTAAEALALGAGLCQDYSHIMLAVCRAAGLPARYVSGHLLGEGASHAWVEVLLPSQQPGYLEAWPLDPTNHCQARHKYITIAVGRDYADVAPTSGSFLGAYPGHLTVSKRAGLTAVEYTDGQVVSLES
ncbi:MAG: transglutaminase family protein [Chloroflexi bacterium]|nr:transglutaminase family protein [Chloroflexota bacterium]